MHGEKKSSQMSPLRQKCLGYDAKKVSVASNPKRLCFKGHNWEPLISQCGLKSTIFIEFELYIFGSN